MTKKPYSCVRKMELTYFNNVKILIIVLLLSVSLNSEANKAFEPCISQMECNEETYTEKNIKHKSVYISCMKEQRSYYHNLQASGMIEVMSKNIIEEWKTYCKLEADTKVYNKKEHQVRLHGVIDPKVANTKGGLASDINQAKMCWVKNPPPICDISRK